MPKTGKKGGSTATVITRNVKQGEFIVRKGDGTVRHLKVKKSAASALSRAAKRHERVLKRLADK